MGSIQTNIAVTEQNFTNNILQSSKNDCWANTTSNTDNNVVIADGTIVGGNFIGVQTSTNTDASCVITSTMETTVDDILKSIIQQTNQSSNSLFGGFTFSGNTNVFNARQTVVNNITQLNETVCAANTVKTTNGNYIYSRNQSVFGDFIGVNSNSESTASCTMNNTMKNSVYNEAQASNNQDNQIQSMFVAIIAAIASVIGGIVLLGFLLLGGGTVAVTELSSGGGGGSNYDADTDERDFQRHLDEQYAALDNYRSQPGDNDRGSNRSRGDDYGGSRDDYGGSNRSRDDNGGRSRVDRSPPPAPNNSPASPSDNSSAPSNNSQAVSVQS